MNFWDVMSLTLSALVASPGFGFVFSLDILYLYQIVGIIFCHFFIKLTRMMPKNSITLRPPNARDCNIFNKGGDASSRIGMPSGHVLLTTFILLSLGFIYNYRGRKEKNNIIYFNSYVAFAAIFILLMAISRIMRNCHTVLQVVVGFVLGALIYYVWAKLINIVNKNDK